MFILILMAITTAGQIAVKTIPFSNDKHCELAAKKLNEKTDKDVKVIAVCIDRGLSH